MAVLICWNNEDYIWALGQKFRDFIIVTSEKETFAKINGSDIELIIVLIELRWEGKKYSELFGLEIGRKLRSSMKLTVPIIFVSFIMPRALYPFYKHKSQQNRLSILKASGSYFRSLPFSEIELVHIGENVNRITEACLLDLIDKCCNPIGTIIDKLHPLKSNLKVPSGENFHELIALCDLNLTQEQKTILRYNEFAIDTKKAIVDNNVEMFRESILNLESRCVNLANTIKNAPVRGMERDSIKALLVDDDKNNCENIKGTLLRQGVEVDYFTDSTEALEFLNDDDSNQYSVIIADWRLYKNDDEEWQDLQGYDFLEKAAAEHFHASIALTSMNDYSIHEIRNKLSTKIDLFKKDHLIKNNNWEIFADVLYQKHQEITDILTHLPQSPEWYKVKKKKNTTISSYNEQYRALRAGCGWQNFEMKLSEVANELWKNFSGALGDYPMSVKPLKEFQIRIDDSIRSLLIARRIWIALWFNRDKISHQDSIKAIYNIMMHGEIDVSEQEKKSASHILNANGGQSRKSTKSNSHSTFANSLALKSTNINAELLKEELNWLVRQGISIKPASTDDLDYDESEPLDRNPSDEEIREARVRPELDDDQI